MFCKWCGATISESSTRCKRCGRDVPALSDCGGFYDLFPNAPKGVQETPSFKVQSPSGASAAQSQALTKHSEESSAPKKAGTSRTHRVQPALLCCSALVLLFLIILIGNIHEYTSELERLRGEMDNVSSHIREIQEAIANHNDTELSKPSEPAMTSEPILAEQNVDLNLEIANEKSGMTVVGDACLGNCKTPVSIVVRFDKISNTLVNAGFIIGKHEGIVDVAVHYGTESGDGVQVGCLFVKMGVDEALFGTQNVNPTYQWKYRLAGDEEWSDLPEIFHQTKKENGTGFSYKINDLVALTESDDFELQLVFRRQSINGGILTLTISGIRILQGI